MPMSKQGMWVLMDAGFHVQQKRPSVENRCLTCEKRLMVFLTFYLGLISFSEFEYVYDTQEGWTQPHSLRALMKENGTSHLYPNVHFPNPSLSLSWLHFLTAASLFVREDGFIALNAVSLKSECWQGQGLVKDWLPLPMLLCAICCISWRLWICDLTPKNIGGYKRQCCVDSFTGTTSLSLEAENSLQPNPFLTAQLLGYHRWTSVKSLSKPISDSQPGRPKTSVIAWFAQDCLYLATLEGAYSLNALGKRRQATAIGCVDSYRWGGPDFRLAGSLMALWKMFILLPPSKVIGTRSFCCFVWFLILC